MTVRADSLVLGDKSSQRYKVKGIKSRNTFESSDKSAAPKVGRGPAPRPRGGAAPATPLRRRAPFALAAHGHARLLRAALVRRLGYICGGRFRKCKKGPVALPGLFQISQCLSTLVERQALRRARVGAFIGPHSVSRVVIILISKSGKEGDERQPCQLGNRRPCTGDPTEHRPGARSLALPLMGRCARPIPRRPVSENVNYSLRFTPVVVVLPAGPRCRRSWSGRFATQT